MVRTMLILLIIVAAFLLIMKDLKVQEKHIRKTVRSGKNIYINVI